MREQYVEFFELGLRSFDRTSRALVRACYGERRIEESDHMMDSRHIDRAIYIAAHVHASRHRAEIEASVRCGCFFCFRSFASADIKTWIDADQTALCPRCGVDSVIGSASRHRIDDVFLRGMHEHFFSNAKR